MWDVTRHATVGRTEARDPRHRGPSRRRGHGDEGAALVEFALILPLLVVLLLGTITAGLSINDELQLNHSARDAARYGATVPEDQTFASGTWATNVRLVAVTRFGGDLSAGDVCVALVSGVTPVPLSSDHTTETSGGACFDDSAAGISATRVQVAASTDAQIETGLYTFDLSLDADAVTMHESNV